MAIIIKTDNPNILLDNIYAGIESKRVEKWAILNDGRLTYSTLLWRNETFFKPEIWVEESELRFGLIKRKDRKNMPSKMYTHYHTKMVEMLLTYFDTEFISVTATALRTDPDDF